MNCQEAQSLIEDVIDRRLSGRAKNRFDLHLARCASCRALLAAEQREHAQWFRAFNAPEVSHETLPDGFADRLVAAVAARSRRRSIFARMPRWVRIAASLAVVASLAAFGSWVAVNVGDYVLSERANASYRAEEKNADETGGDGLSTTSWPGEMPITADSSVEPMQPIPIQKEASMKSTITATALAIGSVTFSSATLQAAANDNSCIVSGSTERFCASTAWAESVDLDTRIVVVDYGVPLDSLESRFQTCCFGDALAKFFSDEPSGCTIIIR